MRIRPLLVAAALLIAGCGDKTDDEPGSQSGPELDGRTFIATSITNGSAAHQLVKDTELRVSFREGNIGLNAGCNAIGGTYEVVGDALEVGATSTTEMGCAPQLMDQDAWLAELFTGTMSFALAGDDLTLTSGDVLIELTDREVASPDRPLEGTTWTLESLITGDAVSSVPGGYQATLRIKDGQLSLDSACSSLDAAVDITDDTIAVGDSGSGSASSGCSMEQEAVDETIHDILSGPMTWSIEERSLTLTNGDKGLGFRAE